MNYTKIYSQLIEKAQLREMPDEYCELHHIVPRCLLGTDDKSNLVALTLREHFIAHRLLVKMHFGNRRLLHALSSFMLTISGRRIICSRQFEFARKASREAKLGKKRSPETKARMSAANKGKVLSTEHRAKISSANTGKKRSADSIEKMRRPKTEEHKRKTGLANKGKVISQWHRDIISAANKGRQHTAEARRKISEAQIGVPNPMTDETRQKLAAINIERQHVLRSMRVDLVLTYTAAQKLLKSNKACYYSRYGSTE